MNLLKKYHSVFIPVLFILGFIIPFNGFWLSGLFYFVLSWLGFIGYISSFKLNLLLHSYYLIGYAVPVFTFLTIVLYAIYELTENKLSSQISQCMGIVNIFAYTSFLYLTVTDILRDDFTFSFFNQTLWFLSSFLCLLALFKWSKTDTIVSGDNHHGLYKIPKN